MAKRNPSLEPSLIENCVKRSREMIILKGYLASLKECKLFQSTISRNFPKSESITSLIKSTELAIEEHRQTIAFYLHPLLEQFGYKVDLKEGFWFTYKQMKKGYVTFYKGTSEKPICVLVLSSFESGILSFKAGELHEYSLIEESLKDAKSIEGISTLALRYALRKFKESNGKNRSKSN